MPSKRSRPLLIAPLIPAWAILGLYISEYLRGTAYFNAFVIAWGILAAVLFSYILLQVLEARKMNRKVKGGRP